MDCRRGFGAFAFVRRHNRLEPSFHPAVAIVDGRCGRFLGRRWLFRPADDDIHIGSGADRRPGFACRDDWRDTLPVEWFIRRPRP